MKMLKTVSAFAAAALISGCFLTGCSLKPAESSQKAQSSSAISELSSSTVSSAKATSSADNTSTQEIIAASSSQIKTETYTSADGKPPVSPELKKLYTEALEIYRGVGIGMLTCETDTIQIGEQVYAQVTDKRFDSVAELRTYMEKYFTAEAVKENLDAKMWDKPKYIDRDGHLYQMSFGRGGNMMYAGHVFKTVKANDSEMELPVTVYWAKESVNQPESVFYTTPDKLDDYTTKEYTFRLTKVNGEWRFSNFYLLDMES